MIRPYPVKIPKIFKSIFNKWIWSFSTKKKEVYLTFDDGPIPEITPWVLEQLKLHNAKATFFCIGENVKKHPNILNQIIEDDHIIGNHTFNHLKGWSTNPQHYIKNVLLAEKHLPKSKRLLFRPPYGKITITQSIKLRKLGYKIIMWNLLSADFDKNLTYENCTKNVLNNISNGSIIVFHDSIKAFPRLQKTLPKVLKELSKKGYRFKAIP